MIVIDAPVIPDLDQVPSGLDWQAFSAAYFPGSRRHDLRALVAYGDYRRSFVAGKQQATRADASGVAEWEDEGGASQ